MLSIITINYNDAKGLQKTMESVFAQTFTDYEYIIIDGGSADGSVDEIKKHENKLVYWVSEKDTGIYNAMNKGILKANGEYLLFLNSGDYIINNEALSHLIAQSSDKDIVYGKLIINDKGTMYYKSCPEKLSFSFFLRSTLPHSSTLIKRHLFTNFGLYNEALKTTSDWEFYLHAICKHNATYKQVQIPFAVFNTDGISSQKENRGWIREDKKNVLQKYYSTFLDDYRMLDEYKIKIEDYQQRLTNIENSRFWKFRNLIVNNRVVNFFFKRRQ